MLRISLNQYLSLILSVIFPIFLIAQDRSTESDILFLKIQELEMEMANLRNELEAQDLSLIHI